MWIYEPRDKWEAHVDMTRCRASLMDNYVSYQCKRKAVTAPDTQGIRWCKQHAPETIEQRLRLSDERYTERVRQEQERIHRKCNEELAALREEVHALKRTLAGD